MLPISVVNTRLFSSSDDEKPSKIVAEPSKSSKPESSKQNPEAISKLNMLLQQIVEVSCLWLPHDVFLHSFLLVRLTNKIRKLLIWQSLREEMLRLNPVQNQQK